MNSNEIFKKAKKIIEQKRIMSEFESDEKRELLYSQIPELAKIDSKKTSLGIMAARLAADGQGDKATEKLNEIKQLENKKKSLLNAKGYRLEDLQPIYRCTFCNDTGVYEGKYCKCMEEEAKKIRRHEIHSKGALRKAGFENFSLDKYPDYMEGCAISPKKAMQAMLMDVIDYAETFGPKSESIYIYGNAGLGKTHIALSVAEVVLNKGYDVIYVSAQSAFAEVSDNKYENGGEMFKSMLDADLLILDDLGTEFQDSYTLSMLYRLVNTRMHNKPTIYTTNICSADLLNMRYTEKIASRLMGDCHLMRFMGEDIRMQKKSNN